MKRLIDKLFLHPMHFRLGCSTSFGFQTSKNFKDLCNNVFCLFLFVFCILRIVLVGVNLVSLFRKIRTVVSFLHVGKIVDILVFV